MAYTPFTMAVIELIKQIPHGKVATYGQIAAAAGSPRAARQVVRVLNSCSSGHNLPWWRVVAAKGRLAIPGGGFYEQLERLQSEDIEVNNKGYVNLTKYGWQVPVNHSNCE